MSTIWMDVDAALSEVPVNACPLTDDTDFKAVEEGITYDQAGMDLYWHFITTAGVMTVTAVTPTTGGVHDWAHQDHGMYTVEIPASGGTVDNDTEGFGYFTGFCTGVLPWRGPTIGFRAAGLNNALVDSAWSATRGLTGTAVPAVAADGAGGLTISDAGGVDMDAMAEAVGNIANVGAATHEPAIASPDGFVITTGTNEVNNEDATHARGGDVHSIDDDGGTLDCHYVMDIGGAFTPVSITWHGRLNGSNDSVNVYANTGTLASPSWQLRDSVSGTNLSINTTHTFIFYTGDSMTGVDAGKVACRFQGTGLSSATLTTDRITAEKTSKADNTGYTDGAIWYDDTAGNTTTVVDVDGTARNPVSTWAAVKTLIGSTGLTRARIANGSTVTLDANSDKYSLVGDEWTLALGGQSVEGLYVYGAQVSGTGTTTTTRPRFEKCGFGATTLGPCILRWCGFGGTFTGGSDGQYAIVDCVSMAPGSGAPTFVFTGTGATTGINNRRWAGGATYTLDSDCTLSHEVLTGGGVSVTTGGADVEIRGITRSIELVLSGAGTVQTDVVTGPITISGTATTTVNLYGVSSSLADTSINTTVTDATVSSTNVVDEFESQSQADPTGFHVNVVEWLSQACAAVSANGVPEVDITRLAGSTDGITGLIDFCTNGYDIITSKVAGVVLVDTTTTNADMRGTDGANTTKTGYSLGSTGLNLVLVDGETLPSALQIIAASVIGKISGAGTATEIFVGLDGNTTRATVTVDVDGNRTNVVYV